MRLKWGKGSRIVYVSHGRASVWRIGESSLFSVCSRQTLDDLLSQYFFALFGVALLITLR